MLWKRYEKCGLFLTVAGCRNVENEDVPDLNKFSTMGEFLG